MAVYAPKRIAFDDSYEVRVGIAVGLKNEQEKFMANVLRKTGMANSTPRSMFKQLVSDYTAAACEKERRNDSYERTKANIERR